MDVLTLASESIGGFGKPVEIIHLAFRVKCPGQTDEKPEMTFSVFNKKLGYFGSNKHDPAARKKK